MDKLFDEIRNKLAHQEDAVPADAWENIVQADRRRRPLAGWLAAVAIFTGLGIFAVVKWQEQTTDAVGNPSVTTQAGTVAKSSLPDAQTPLTDAGASATTDRTTAPANNPSRTPSTETVNSINNQNEASKAEPVPFASKATTAVTDHKHTTGNKRRAPRSTKQRLNMLVAAPDATANNQTGNNNEKTGNDLSVDSRKAYTQDREFKVAVEPATASEGTTQADPSPLPMIQENPPVQPKTTPAASVSSELRLKRKQHKPWMLELNLVPVLPVDKDEAAFTLNRSLLQSNGKADFTGRLDHTKVDPAMAVGITLRKAITPKLSIGAGVQFLQLKERVIVSGKQTNTIYSFGQPHLDPDGSGMIRDTITTVMTTDREFRFTNRLTYVSIPLNIQYQVWRKSRWSLDAEAGILWHMTIRYQNNFNEKLIAPLLSDPVLKTSGDTKMGLAFTGALRLSHPLAKRMDWFVKPGFTINPNAVGLMQKHVHQLTVGFGLQYRF
jgi:hypothetical protein